MATSYSTILDRAQFRVSDYDALKQTFQMHYDVMRKHLMSAAADFAPYCRFDLNDRDDALAQFNADLDDECVEILACGVAAYWLSALVMNTDLLQNRLSTKEFSYFSPANLLNAASTLRKETRKEFRSEIIQYTYRHGNIEAPGQEASSET